MPVNQIPEHLKHLKSSDTSGASTAQEIIQADTAAFQNTGPPDNRDLSQQEQDAAAALSAGAVGDAAADLDTAGLPAAGDPGAGSGSPSAVAAMGNGALVYVSNRLATMPGMDQDDAKDILKCVFQKLDAIGPEDDPRDPKILLPAVLECSGEVLGEGGEDFFNAIQAKVNEAVALSGGDPIPDDPMNLPVIPLMPFVKVMMVFDPAGSVDDVASLECFEAIIGPLLRLSYLVMPIPPIPAPAIVLGLGLPLILDCLGWGPINHSKIDELIAAGEELPPEAVPAAIIGAAMSIANIVLGYTLILLGLSLDVLIEIQTKQMQGSATLMSVPPIPGSPLVIVAPSMLQSVSMLKDPMAKAIMAWGAAHVPPVDLRIGGMIPLVLPF